MVAQTIDEETYCTANLPASLTTNFTAISKLPSRTMDSRSPKEIFTMEVSHKRAKPSFERDKRRGKSGGRGGRGSHSKKTDMGRAEWR